MNARVQELHSQIEEEKAELSALERKIVEKSMKQNMLNRAKLSLLDVETYLRHAETGPTQRAIDMWLSAAELTLQIVAQQRKAVEAIIANFGQETVTFRD
jgi:hypothetical protein